MKDKCENCGIIKDALFLVRTEKSPRTRVLCSVCTDEIWNSFEENILCIIREREWNKEVI